MNVINRIQECELNWWTWIAANVNQCNIYISNVYVSYPIFNFPFLDRDAPLVLHMVCIFFNMFHMLVSVVTLSISMNVFFVLSLYYQFIFSVVFVAHISPVLFNLLLQLFVCLTVTPLSKRKNSLALLSLFSTFTFIMCWPKSEACN